MRSFMLGVAVFALSVCSEREPGPPGVGEVCDEDLRCAAELRCIHRVCVDDEGPSLDLSMPAALTAYTIDSVDLWVWAPVYDARDDAQVELTIDLDSTQSHQQLEPIEDGFVIAQVVFPKPLAVGPHRLRARIVDADGKPYPNPSASKEIVVFVRDPDVPNTPQIALVWPPSGHEHRAGQPLEFEVAVLPESFTFASQAETCEPAPDCEPAFAPECEGSCGPVSRAGHVKFYTLPDYPGCLLDTPLNCNGEYLASFRPGGETVVDGFTIRGEIQGTAFAEPGSIVLHTALSYDHHQPYPTEAGVIHETITLNLVE